MSRNQRILRALKEAGITQSALAKVLDVTLATVSARLNGEKEIDSYDFLAAVSRLTGRSIEWLAEGGRGGVNSVSEATIEQNGFRIVIS